MKFIASSTQLLTGLNSVSKVIASKSALQILDNYLLVLQGNTLSVTASNGETTLKTDINIEKVFEDGQIAVPARLFTESLRSLPDQPLTFATDSSSALIITWASGASKIPYLPAEDYPSLPAIGEDFNTLSISADALLNGVSDTIYATAEEELRPVMNGIYFDITPDALAMVASDAHKLICYTFKDIKSAANASFILHKKPAAILKSILAKVEDEVVVKFDKRNAFFSFGETLLVCRLIDGNYPAYRSVIPKNNPNKMTISRTELLGAVRRMAVYSNQATSVIMLKVADGELMISAEDTGNATSAYERLNCEYEGVPVEIGFKAPFLADILNNFCFDNISMLLADSCRPGLIVSADGNNGSEDLCAVLMPIMV
ncbi:MAG: DNA polymerase III subunit beta [Bacteroidales bacterium]|nr:DNA polymerase III subunit beta [Candidatus Equibacterium intestinale]